MESNYYGPMIGFGVMFGLIATFIVAILAWPYLLKVAVPVLSFAFKVIGFILTCIFRPPGLILKWMGRALSALWDWFAMPDDFSEKPKHVKQPFDEGATFYNFSDRNRKDIISSDFYALRHRIARTYDWTAERLEMAEREYRRFVSLIKKNSSATIVPWDPDLDLFWQEHILDTRAYAEFCDRVFGFFLHRDPSLTNGSLDWENKLGNTAELYRKEFVYAPWAGDAPAVDDELVVELFPSEEPDKQVNNRPKEKGGE